MGKCTTFHGLATRSGTRELPAPAAEGEPAARGFGVDGESCANLIPAFQLYQKCILQKDFLSAILTAWEKGCIITVLYYSVMWRAVWKKR